jgi:glycine oxidase
MLKPSQFADTVTAGAVIIGGGVIGLSISRELGRRGFGKIIIIERGGLGLEASHAAGGMLAPQAEADAADDFFRLAAASRDMYPEFADSLKRETGIDIELDTTGTIYLAFTDEDAHEIRTRFEWQSAAGMRVEKLSAEDARILEPAISPRVSGALLFPNDTQVENRRLLAALANSVNELGIEIQTSTEADEIVFESHEVLGVKTSRGFISTRVVVVAAGAWSSMLNFSGEQTPDFGVSPVRGQMLCFESTPRLSRHVIYSPRGYLVPRLDGRLLAGSTSEDAGFDKRVTGEGVSTIMANALEISPAVSKLSLSDTWAGLRPRSRDGLPVLGGLNSARGLFFATGHFRNGILLAPITGKMLADEICGEATDAISNSFSPNRFLPVGVS